MKAMTPAKWRAFLLFGTRTAKLATVRSDGRPHVAPVWFDLDGNDLIFMTGVGTVKGKNILRDPRVMISVDDENPPFAFVLIESGSGQRTFAGRSVAVVDQDSQAIYGSGASRKNWKTQRGRGRTPDPRSSHQGYRPSRPRRLRSEILRFSVNTLCHARDTVRNQHPHSAVLN
jgi:hypothetical protein